MITLTIPADWEGVLAQAARHYGVAVEWLGDLQQRLYQNGRSGKSGELPDNAHVGRLPCPTYRYILFRKSPWLWKPCGSGLRRKLVQRRATQRCLMGWAMALAP